MAKKVLDSQFTDQIFDAAERLRARIGGGAQSRDAAVLRFLDTAWDVAEGSGRWHCDWKALRAALPQQAWSEQMTDRQVAQMAVDALFEEGISRPEAAFTALDRMIAAHDPPYRSFLASMESGRAPAGVNRLDPTESENVPSIDPDQDHDSPLIELSDLDPSDYVGLSHALPVILNSPDPELRQFWDTLGLGPLTEAETNVLANELVSERKLREPLVAALNEIGGVVYRNSFYPETFRERVMNQYDRAAAAFFTGTDAERPRAEALRWLVKVDDEDNARETPAWDGGRVKLVPAVLGLIHDAHGGSRFNHDDQFYEAAFVTFAEDGDVRRSMTPQIITFVGFEKEAEGNVRWGVQSVFRYPSEALEASRMFLETGDLPQGVRSVKGYSGVPPVLIEARAVPAYGDAVEVSMLAGPDGYDMWNEPASLRAADGFQTAILHSRQMMNVVALDGPVASISASRAIARHRFETGRADYDRLPPDVLTRETRRGHDGEHDRKTWAAPGSPTI